MTINEKITIVLKIFDFYSLSAKIILKFALLLSFIPFAVNSEISLNIITNMVKRINVKNKNNYIKTENIK